MAMLSPGNTAVGLTTDEPGADTEPGEPDNYYPTGTRNYARIVPKDTVQGAALATVMDEDGCTTVGILHDKEVYGEGLAENVELAGEEFDYEAHQRGASTQGGELPLGRRPRTWPSQGVDCFFFSGITANGAVQLYKDVAAAIPDAKLYGADGVAESTFSGTAACPRTSPADTKVTVATLDPRRTTEPRAPSSTRTTRRSTAREPSPYAIYGYEAGQLILDVLERAEDPTDRASVMRGDVRDRGPRLDARHLLDRRERRHDADRLRGLHDRRRRARLRPEDLDRVRREYGDPARGRAPAPDRVAAGP